MRFVPVKPDRWGGAWSFCCATCGEVRPNQDMTGHLVYADLDGPAFTFYCRRCAYQALADAGERPFLKCGDDYCSHCGDKYNPEDDQ